MNAENQEHKNFEELRRRYFIGLGLKAREFLKMHKAAGLWEGKKGERWDNVAEHSLVQAARADVLAEKLGLPQDVRDDLFGGAILHDYQKKQEREFTKAEGGTWQSFSKVYEDAAERLRQAGYRDSVIRLANSAGHSSLLETQEILKKGELSDQDTAFLVMHYVDDYTLGSEWVMPAERTVEGRLVNDLDRRVERNENNEFYRQLNEEGKQYFDGETTFQAQKRIGHEVEARLAGLLAEKSGEPISPSALPEYVDGKIKERIYNL